MPPLRFAALASGGGSNLQAILDKIQSGDLAAVPAFVASNNSQSQALERARRAGIPSFHVSAKTEGSEISAAARIIRLLDEHAPDLLVLAGYMKKVQDALLNRMRNRVLNIHPALLPAFGGEGFYGHKVHEAVVRRGCQYTGMTVHVVNGEYDAGQILLQRVVVVPGGSDVDAVAARVLSKEHDSYWRVLRGFAEGDLVATESADPAAAVRVNPDWLRRMRALDGGPT